MSVVWKFHICFHVFSGAVVAHGSSCSGCSGFTTPLPLLIQGMTPCLKPIVNVRFANKLTRQQKISLPLCYLSLLRVPFLTCWVCLSLIKENFSCNYTNRGGGGILVSFSTMKLFLRSISASLRSHTWGPDCNTFKRAVLRQSSSFCLILPITRLQLLWNLK